MKKNIVGILAILVALSASAFTSSHKVVSKRTTDLKWFSISGSISTSASVPSANATYLSGQDGPTPPDEGCSGSGHQCVSGFDASQVNPSTNKLIGTQMPVDATTEPRN
ncbi:MAG: hypothetical protein V4577_08455 [Bacteroidota bacterium]